MVRKVRASSFPASAQDLDARGTAIPVTPLAEAGDSPDYQPAPHHRLRRMDYRPVR